MLKYRHSGKLSEIIYSLPTFFKLGGGQFLVDTKQTYVLNYHMPLNHHECQEIIVFLESQNISAKEKEDENYDYDLDNFRNMIFHDLNKHIGLAIWESQNLPSKSFDINLKYVNFKPIEKAQIIINSPNPSSNFNWNILEKYKDKCIFIGKKSDYDNFPLNKSIKYYKSKDILEFSGIIAGAKLFIGNEDLGSTLAEAMQIPRILDTKVGRFIKSEYTELSEFIIESNIENKKLKFL